MKKQSSRVVGILLAAGVLLLVAGGTYLVGAYWLPPRRIAEAQEAMKRGNVSRAGDLAEGVLWWRPDHPQALAIAAEAAATDGKIEIAMARLDRLAGNRGDFGVRAQFRAADLLVGFGRVGEAEQRLHHLLDTDPKNVEAHDRLAMLYETQGRTWEAQPHLFEVIRTGLPVPEALVLIGNRHVPFGKTERIEDARKKFPEAGWPYLAMGFRAANSEVPAQAIPILVMALERDKTQIEAHALLGLVLADAEKADKAIAEWHRQLPTTAEDHPDIWTARGAWALRRDEPKMAARCFLEAARRDPDQRVALLELAQILEHQGDAARAAPFRERAEKLAVLEKKLAPLLEQHEDPAPMREVAELATALGRRFEARGWYNMVLAFEPDDESAKKAIAALGLDDDPAAPRVDPSANPALKIDLAEFPAFEPGS